MFVVAAVVVARLGGGVSRRRPGARHARPASRSSRTSAPGSTRSDAPRCCGSSRSPTSCWPSAVLDHGSLSWAAAEAYRGGEAGLATHPRSHLGDRDRASRSSSPCCWPTGSMPGSGSRPPPSSSRSSTCSASGSGSSSSRSPRRPSSWPRSRSRSGDSRTPHGAPSTTRSRAYRRAQVMAFQDGVPGQIGTILSGVLLLTAASVLRQSRSSGSASSWPS